MIKIAPEYSRSQVKKAGKVLKYDDSTEEDVQWAEDVLTNWRGIHFYPLNTFRSTLTEKLRKVDEEALIAQRLKRAPSIILKLRRFPKMLLTKMQDVGGLRAILQTVNQVKELEENYLNSRFSHELINRRDYIESPKESGYRSIHLIYKYQNKLAPEYNGLLIELQFRTRLQHIWATAVETMGTFLDHALKSSEGPEEWLSFFALVSSAFAIIEKCPKVPQFTELDDNETFHRVLEEARNLAVVERFNAFRDAANTIIDDNSHQGGHHIVILDLENWSTTIKSYGRTRIEEANEEYSKVEERISEGENLQVVLVATSSLDALLKAYPNYFVDTADFIDQIEYIKEFAIE